MAMVPRVIDIYSRTKVNNDSFVKAKADGIWAVIHKASEGETYKDKTVQKRRQMAVDAGLLVGFYHFNYGNDYKDQVSNFIEAAQPDEETLICLDFEDHVVDMSITAAVSFMKEIEDRLAKSCAIYSGNRLKQYYPNLSKSDQLYLASKKLWVAQYSPKLTLPKNWKNNGGDWWLWQYTGDDVGPQPHQVNGFAKGIDLSVYNNDDYDKFKAEWTN